MLRQITLARHQWGRSTGLGRPFQWDHSFSVSVIPTCATVAYLYHHAPQELLRLPYPATHKRGRGPFYVIGPA